MNIRIALGFALALCATPVLAQNCTTYPYDLTNGQTADADQVMANFASILSCANSQLAHSGVNSDITQLLSVTNLAFAPANSNITSLTGLTTPLAVTEGGTGANNASNARTNLGLGTAAVENLLGSVVDDGAGNLTVGNSGVVAGSYTNPLLNISADGRITSATSTASSASAATAGQMEAGTSNTVFASPNNLQYSQNAVRAWVGFQYNGGLTVFGSYNIASVSRTNSTTYQITLAAGLNFSDGEMFCLGNDGGAPIAIAPQTGVVGVSAVITVNTPSDPTDHAECMVVGQTTN
jgi:hypothetical protein